MTTAGSAPYAHPDDEPWYDEILAEDDNSVTVRVTTSEGRKIIYRLLLTPLPDKYAC